jgi:hypothetical protein
MFMRTICPEANKDSKMNSSRGSVARVRTFHVSHNGFRGLYLGGSSTKALAFGTANLVLAALSTGSLAGTKVLFMISLP